MRQNITKVVLIPAYKPDEKLIDLLKSLSDSEITTVVVNDGSGPEYDPVFRLAELTSKVICHDENRGKGAALKTGIHYIDENIPKPYVVVTADADGQHSVTDILRVMDKAVNNPDKLILGSRKIEGKTPLRSRFGNSLTRLIFRSSTGVKVYDAQTGLRAFSSENVPFLINIEGNRYEYEMNVLLNWTRAKKPIEEMWIETIYDKGNTSSHFHVIRDSVLIYSEIIKFAGASLISFVVDYLLFCLLYFITGSLEITGALFISNVAARVMSAVVNYNLNRVMVFKSDASVKKSAVQYAMLATFILIMNSVVLDLYTMTGMPAQIAKILTELTLFIISLTVQRKVIFRKKELKGALS